MLRGRRSCLILIVSPHKTLNRFKTRIFRPPAVSDASKICKKTVAEKTRNSMKAIYLPDFALTETPGANIVILAGSGTTARANDPAL